ncbi:MAG: hypothetical protein JNM27_06585 [Leptospirales bacterium]|nr:hypothetical protein [Leptospirales bacterium]
MKGENGAEDLRAYYITPEFLTRLSKRARTWSRSFILEQMAEFGQKHPEYPELTEVLQLELDIRDKKELPID